MREIDRFVELSEQISSGANLSTLAYRAKAIQRVLRNEPIERVAEDTRIGVRFLKTWLEAVQKDGFYGWLGRPEPKPEKLQRARGSLAQMFLALMAEEHFASLAHQALDAQGFHLVDDRIGRTDTDYRLVDVNDRPVCRFNIKFHGTLFRESHEYVGLDTDDCFALATYKIHGALRRQDQEFLPYVFLVLSVPEFPRSLIEESISADFTWLAAISGRATEEQIVRFVSGESWAESIRRDIRQAEFRVISARRANQLLKEKLFERVHALRLRAFNRTFRSAEINMHLSLSSEMMSFSSFVGILSSAGVQGLSVGLERGEI